MKKLLSIIMISILLSSCGTTNSLDEVNYVPYAVVTVSDSLTVTGMLLHETDSTINVAVDGANIIYNMGDIAGYNVVMKPDPHRMQMDIVSNTRSTAGNTGFFVILTIISVAVVVVLQNVQ